MSANGNEPDPSYPSAAIENGPGSKIIARVREYEGRARFDVRLFYRHPKTGRWLPTKRGVFLPLAKVGEFAGVVNAFAEEIERREATDEC